MKKILFLLIFTATAHWAAAQQIFSEDFDLARGTGGWKITNPQFGGPPGATNGGLSYSGYPTASGGSDGSLSLTSGTGGLAHRRDL
ncbi:MAG: hypothetical protein WDO15_01245 [Bacteroidota bacterium]